MASHRITNAYSGLAHTLQTQEAKEKWWGKITGNSSGSSKSNVLAFLLEQTLIPWQQNQREKNGVCC